MSEPGQSARDEGARLLQSGDLNGALNALQAAVQQNPSDARAYAFLGICRTRQGDPAGGIEALYRATQLAPTDAVLRYNLGVALSQSGRVDEAKQALEQALQLNPAHAGAREQLHRLQSAPASAAAGPPPSAVPPYGAGPASAAPPSWAPQAPNASDPTIANSPVWSPAPAASGWNPAPGQPTSGGASTPAGGPPAWTPAPQAGDGPRHDAFTGSPAAMYYAQDQTYGAQPPGLGKRLLRGGLWGLLHGHWWTLWSTISGVIFGRAFGNVGAFALEMVIRGFVYSFFGMLVGLIIAFADLDEEKGVWVGVGAGLVLCVLYMLLTQNFLALINVFFYYVTGREVGRGLAKRIQAPVG